LQEGLSISSAVSRAREGLAADSNSLVGALVSYERERADAAIEAALALRSVERSVADVLLPTLDEIARRYSVESAAWAFAAHWGADWLRRAQRLAPPPVRPVSIVVGDASRDELDPDAPHIRALELFCVRAGVRVLSLSARGVAELGTPSLYTDRISWCSQEGTWVTTQSQGGPTRSGWQREHCQ
jgi:hypothetical protein